MSGHVTKKKLNGSARPIKNKRDFAGAQSAVKKIDGKAERESVAESRLQSLIHAMDKFDGDEEDAEDGIGEGDYAGPLRRWSDDPDDTGLD